MNKFLLSIFLFACSFQSFGQIEKGMLLTGGSFSFSGQNTNNEQMLNIGTSENVRTSYNFYINPEIGRFISESTLIGVGFDLSFYGSNSENVSISPNKIKWRKNVTSIAPYIKKYITIRENFYFTGNLSVSAGVGKQTQSDYPEFNVDGFILGVSARPGLSYFISDRWVIQANLGEIYLNREVWESETDESNDESKTVQYNYRSNFRFNSFGVGFNYIL